MKKTLNILVLLIWLLNPDYIQAQTRPSTRSQKSIGSKTTSKNNKATLSEDSKQKMETLLKEQENKFNSYKAKKAKINKMLGTWECVDYVYGRSAPKELLEYKNQIKGQKITYNANTVEYKIPVSFGFKSDASDSDMTVEYENSKYEYIYTTDDEIVSFTLLGIVVGKVEWLSRNKIKIITIYPKELDPYNTYAIYQRN